MKKEYFAFISYKEDDYKDAKWLQKKLENYRFPTSIRKENPELPDKIRPVFEYKSEMAGGDLKPEINKALADSKYLIVICSPNATQSPWVADEVQKFIDSGRTDKIIPFVVAGEAYSKDPDQECFPEPLRKLTEPKRGISINEMGRNAAAIKVIAEMLGVKFDSLWRRYEREQRRIRRMWFAFFLSLAIAASGVAYWMWQTNTKLETAYTNLDNAYGKIQQDSILQEKHIMRILGDSIRIALQNDSITNTNGRLADTNGRLAKTNKDLSLSRDSIARTNKKLEETNHELNQSRDSISKQNEALIANNLELKKENLRFLMKQADIMLDKGDAVHARMIAYDALTNKDNPYIPEMESVYRRSLEMNGMTINTGMPLVPQRIGFSLDGEYILFADGDMKIYSSTTGEMANKLAQKCLDFTVDDKAQEIVVLTDNQLIYLDKNMKICKRRAIENVGIELIPGNSCIGISNSHLIYLNDFSLASQLDLTKHSNFSISNNQKYIAGRTGIHYDTINVCDIKSGNIVSKFNVCSEESHTNDSMITKIVFCPNDTLLLTSQGSRIKLWNIYTKQCLKVINAPYHIWDMIVTNNGKSIYYTCSDKIYEYNLALGHLKELQVPSGNSYLVDNYQQRVLSAGYGTVHIFGGDHYRYPYKNIYGCKEMVYCAAYCESNGSIVTCGDDSLMFLHTPYRNGFKRIQLKGHCGNVIASAISPDGQNVITFSTDSILRIWNVKEPNSPSFLDKCNFFINEAVRIVYSPLGQNYVISNGYKSFIFSSIQHSKIQELNGWAPCYSKDGKYIYLHSEKGIMRYEINNGRISIINNFIKKGKYIGISPDGRYLTTINSDYTIAIMNLVSPNKTINTIYDFDLKKCVEFSPNGQYFVTAESDKLNIWDTRTGQIIEQVPDIWGLVTYAQFINETSILVTGHSFNGSAICRIINFKKLSELLEIGKDRFFLSPLTEEERRKLYSTDIY